MFLNGKSAQYIAEGINSVNPYIIPVAVGAYEGGRMLYDKYNQHKPSGPSRVVGGFPSTGGGGGGPGPHGGYVPYSSQRKRRGRRRKFKRRKLSKKVKKAVKRVVSGAMHPQGIFNRIFSISIASNVNCCGWFEASNKSRAAWNEYLMSEIMTTAAGGVTSTVTQDPQDIASVASVTSASIPKGSKKYHITQKCVFHLRNNTNSPAEIILYVLKSNTTTQLSTTDDLAKRYYSTWVSEDLSAATAPTAALTYPNNIMQYWSTPQKGDYDMVKKMKVRLEPESEVKLPVSGSFFYNTWNYGQVFTYAKGTPAFLFRVQGVPGHNSTTTSSVGLTGSRIDCVVTETITVKSSEPSSVAIRKFVGSGMTEATPTDIAADSNVAAFADT